ncbi:hypothetical protein BDY17DRAFT_293020 [Neohortaea acidophila]|uniref:RING-type domain-containing protein n=1 Tax=Neohortaea acidophila TaxID=245834 RepID=A0A6A6Q149_9PEZI|nr:uncharacterized protein BDY17DRAFT_293020 [Neohortaea acidophila]KAF2485147.1 hypothetical protein BDY17DRAFT_293020 [Neohortaea acidophila]
MDFLPLPRPRLWKSKTDFFRPFRAGAEAGENIMPLYDPAVHLTTDIEDLDLKDLNTALAVLVEIFPQVQPEVFREMLVSVSEESRLQLVTEQLLAKKVKGVRTRPLAFPARIGQNSRKEGGSSAPQMLSGGRLNEEQTFRSNDYKKAVKQVLYQEFKSLSHSSIRAVLAEQNFSYTLTRPVLQQLSTKSWRFSFASLWKRKPPVTAAGEHPSIVWQPDAAGRGQASPALRMTGSLQLDQELYDLFVVPAVENQRKALLASDLAVATKLNEKEAEEADALFDCECCFNSVVFEQLTTCDEDCHQLCFDCVRRTAREALYGQGWARTVDLQRTTVCCFAPTTQACEGVIPAAVLRRVLSSGTENEDLWSELQERAASEAILKTRLPIQRCPFCAYIEIDETPPPQRRDVITIAHRLAIRTPITSQILFFVIIGTMALFTIPILVFASYAWLALKTSSPAIAAFNASWKRVYKQRSGLKFQCRSPRCSKLSCVRCLAQWTDPHTCFENEKTSLRTAVEASATAAVKRTCPKCLLSFVKSTGCNKLVCNCGYTMCYICRQEITSKEGYSHFCQHFRPHGGRCRECERCDLYGDEDEEAAIRVAAEAAEKAWKEKEGGRAEGDGRAAQAMVEAVVGSGKTLKTWEMLLDVIVDAVIA